MCRFSWDVMRMIIDTSAAAACRAAVHLSHGYCRGEVYHPPPPPVTKAALPLTDRRRTLPRLAARGWLRQQAASIAAHACPTRPALLPHARITRPQPWRAL